MGFHLKFIMASDPRVLPVVRAAVGELAVVCGLPEETRHGITLAVDEALANVIRHAYNNRHDQEMELDCQVESDRIVFKLLDCGEAPDPDRICGKPLEDTTPGGRGTHLMKAIMDEMSYESVPGKNQLKLVKQFTAAEGSIGGEEDRRADDRKPLHS